MIVRMWWTMAMFAVLLGTLSTGAAGADPEVATACGDGRHVFLVRPGIEEQVWEIAHIDASASPLAIRSIVSFARRPEAIASSGDRCWVLLPAVDATRPVRDLVSFNVVQHPINKVWTVAPPGRLRFLPPVEVESAVVELSASENSPMIVGLPSQRHLRGISRDDAEEGGDDEAGEVRVLRTPDLAAWIDVEPPSGFDRTVSSTAGRLASGTSVVPAIVWRTADGPTRLSGWESDAWSTRSIEAIGGSDPVVFTIGERTLLGFDLGEEGIEICEVRSQADGDQAGWRRLAKVDTGLPSGDLAIVGTSAGPWILGVAGNSVEVVQVDPVTGAVGTVQAPVEDDGAGSLVHLPIPFLVLFASIIATIVLRPLIDRTPEGVATGIERAGLFRRAAAVCIDLVPGAMLSVIIFDLDPATFQDALQAGDAESYPPAIFAILFSGVLAGIIETVWDRSIGKAVVGIKVVDGNGGAGTRLQRGLRAGLKINILFMPLIAVIAAVDPNGRGLPELATRTVVVPAKTSAATVSDVDS